MQKRTAILTGLLACGLAAGSAAAQEIYRWTDENGVVHFSDTAAGAKSGAVSTVTIEDTRPSDYDPEADIYNVAAQTERMQARRDEMQKKRESRREQQRHAAAAPQPAPVTRSVGYGLPPWWWDRPDHGRPPRPEPPIEPPPDRPPTATLRPPGGDRD